MCATAYCIQAGNLASVAANSTTGIEIPGCSGYDYQGSNCFIAPQTLAKMYGYFDAFGVLIILGGYMWLRLFEKREEMILNNNTGQCVYYVVYIPAMYTSLFIYISLLINTHTILLHISHNYIHYIFHITTHHYLPAKLYVVINMCVL